MNLHTVCSLALLLAGAAKPMSTKTPTITIEGQRLPTEKAHFGIEIQAEAWDEKTKTWKAGLELARASYWLNVVVDEHSGEDGAPAPTIEDLPVPGASGGRHPSLATLGTLTLAELDGGDEWESWFGNDAPSLYGNVLRFQGWEGASLRVHWTARYDERGKPLPFELDGPVEFTGIHVSVRRGEDPDAYVKAAWGGQDTSTLERHLLGRHDHGPRWPAERRYTEAYVYLPKGMALSSYWTKGDTVAPDARR